MAKRGAPKGNSNRMTHGLIGIQSAVARRGRRGRDRIDKRSSEGREALDLRSGLIADLGGLESVTTAEFAVIVGFSETWWLRSMQYNAIARYLKKRPELRDNPKVISTMFSYVAPIEEKIARYLQLLGLEKRPPPVKSLEEILSESDDTDNVEVD